MNADDHGEETVLGTSLPGDRRIQEWTARQIPSLMKQGGFVSRSVLLALTVGMFAGWAAGHLARPHWTLHLHPSGAMVLLEERSGRVEWIYSRQVEVDRPGQSSWWWDWLSR